MERYEKALDPHFDDILGKHPRKAWAKFVHADNQHLVNDEVVDLIDRMLVYDHAKRILPQEALQHPFFLPLLREEEAQANHRA